MAKKSTSKSAVVRQYLESHQGVGNTDLSKLIAKEQKMDVTPKFISTIKAKAKNKPAGKKTTAAKPAKKTKPAKAANAKPKAAPVAGVSASVAAHIANLKAATHKLGKDEAKKIIDLF